MSRTLTIATRESPLALWQAEYVQSTLMRAHPGLDVQLLGGSAPRGHGGVSGQSRHLHLLGGYVVR